MLGFAAAVTTAAGTMAFAQEGMRPVPRFSGTSVRDQRTESQKASGNTQLQWRTSTEVAPVVPQQPTVAAFNNQPAPNGSPATESSHITTVRYVSPAAQTATSGRHGAAAHVLQARYQNELSMPDEAGGLQLPPGLQATPPAEPANPLPDFFSDPFGDSTPDPVTPVPGAPRLDAPSPVTPPAVQVPTLPNNDLRAPSTLGQPTMPSAQDEAEPDALPAPIPRSETPEPTTPAPAEEGATNPFDRLRSQQPKPADDADLKQLEDFEMPSEPNRKPQRAPRTREEDEDFLRPQEFSCDEFRKSIAEATIQKVSLDISPPFRPDIIELDEFRKLKTRFDEAQEVRDWMSIDGRKLGRGRLQDLAYEKVVIETEFGTREELPINRISEADLAYLSKNWGLPQECLIEQTEYVPRNWQHAKVTWKASNLCHKPLYFEDVNLERYGHTAGPFAQPLVSSAHFFFNIAVLPYKMGVHAPNECQYTLGYYRPGNCAPWICPPVPISVRGGLYQAAAMTGAFWLIP